MIDRTICLECEHDLSFCGTHTNATLKVCLNNNKQRKAHFQVCKVNVCGLLLPARRTPLPPVPENSPPPLETVQRS